MGGKQLGFGDYEQSTAKKQTKKEKFLAEMDKVVPWQALIDLIEPFYPKTGSKGGRPPYALETMLRIHLMQHWYALSDPAMEDALIEVPTMRRFAGIDLISERIPDETTILTFRHLLEKHDLGEKIFETVKDHLKAHGMSVRRQLDRRAHCITTRVTSLGLLHHELRSGVEATNHRRPPAAAASGSRQRSPSSSTGPGGSPSALWGAQRRRETEAPR
jgi:hypothetical protein